MSHYDLELTRYRELIETWRDGNRYHEAAVSLLMQEAAAARARLWAAREALVHTGMFKPSEVGPDIAPLIHELVADLRAEVGDEPEPDVDEPVWQSCWPKLCVDLADPLWLSDCHACGHVLVLHSDARGCVACQLIALREPVTVTVVDSQVDAKTCDEMIRRAARTSRTREVSL